MPKEENEVPSAAKLNCTTNRRNILLSGASLLAITAVNQAAAQTPPPADKMGPATPAPAASAAGGKPNIVMIISDDTGYGDLGLMVAASGAACRRRTSIAWQQKA